jgi:predicted secreted protein
MKVYVSFIFILSFVLGNCSQPSSPIDQTLDSSINGKTVSYTSNYNFSLKLDVHTDGGYLWKYSISDTNIVRIDSTCYLSNPNLIGGVNQETFFFCTIKKGKSNISLVERQPWVSEDAAPINSISFVVNVTD